ncbi:AfsR/SARP family transcriptional regulator [Pseudarthrobacter siccitolerans]
MGRAAAKEDPLNERAWTALILGLERNGEKTEALGAYDRCRQALDEELGCAPSLALKEAHARLLTSTAATHGPTEAWSAIHAVAGRDVAP